MISAHATVDELARRAHATIDRFQWDGGSTFYIKRVGHAAHAVSMEWGEEEYARREILRILNSMIEEDDPSVDTEY